MSTAPTLFPAPTPSLRSGLFKNQPDSIPPTEDLEALQNELRQLKQRSIQRGRKAEDDSRFLDESYRRSMEHEKGKGKVVTKVKKERDFTPLRDGSPAIVSARNRLPSASSSAGTPLSMKPSFDSLRSEDKKKKKKRKRELDDSDIEADSQRPRKASPLPPSQLNHHNHINHHSHSLTPKPQKIPSHSHPPKISSGPDWTLPPPTSLLPSRPAVPPPPIPGPSRTIEVMDDFSKSKQPSQTQVTTFYTSIEPWIRPIKEEDVGFLEYTADEVEPFIVPPLGRHYAAVWAEEDTALYGGPLPGTAAAQYAAGLIATPTARSGTLPRWEPSTLAEPDLLTEERGHGPLTERLLSALIPAPDPNGWKGVKAAEEAMEGRSAGGANAAAERDKMTVADLEERIRDSVRFLGLLDEKLDPAQLDPVDDPVCTALRQAQRQLRTVLAANKARRARLADVARDRLGYQEYLELRDALDRNINAAYARLQKKDAPKASKKKRPSNAANGSHHIQETALPPCPAMLGLSVDDDHVLSIPETLDKLVKTRRQWVDTVGAVFEEKQREQPGRIWGFPEKSLFEGIVDEVRALAGNIHWAADSAGSSVSAANGDLSMGEPGSASSTSDTRTASGQLKMELG